MRREALIMLWCGTALVVGTGCGKDDSGDDAGGDGSQVVGTVKNERGTPIADATVSVGDASAVTDFNGAFVLSGLTPGAATLAVKAIWYQDTEVSVTVPGTAAVTTAVVQKALPLEVKPADKALMESYAASFDWKKDKVSFVYAEAPTRAAIDRALYSRNPALYDASIEQEPAVTPASLDEMAAGAEAQSVFPLATGGEALDRATLVDALSGTPLTAQEIAASVLWEPAIEVFLLGSDPEAATGLYQAGLAIETAAWGGSATFPPQTIEHAFLHGDELWVEVVFQPFVDLSAAGIKDDDGDGQGELYGRVAAVHFEPELLVTLNSDYIQRRFDTIDLVDNLALILDTFYSRTAPEIVSTLGVPYDVAGLGQVAYPFVVLRHSSGVINIFLVAP